MDERVSLVADLFSDCGKIGALKGSSVHDVQPLIDMIDGVPSCSHFRTTGPSVNVDPALLQSCGSSSVVHRWPVNDAGAVLDAWTRAPTHRRGCT